MWCRNRGCTAAELMRAVLIAAGVIAAVQIGAAAVKVHVDLDKAFDFRKVNSWAWGMPEAGRVMVARTPTDDPEAIQRLAEPVIMDAIVAEMPSRGLTQAAYAPDVTVKYYLLLTIGIRRRRWASSCRR